MKQWKNLVIHFFYKQWSSICNINTVFW